MGSAWGSPIPPVCAPLPGTDPEHPPPWVCPLAGLCRLIPREPCCQWAPEIMGPQVNSSLPVHRRDQRSNRTDNHCSLGKLLLTQQLATCLSSCSLALLPWGCAYSRALAHGLCHEISLLRKSDLDPPPVCLGSPKG